jgi:hypothetical protein
MKQVEIKQLEGEVQNIHVRVGGMIGTCWKGWSERKRRRCSESRKKRSFLELSIGAHPMSAVNEYPGKMKKREA